MNRWEDRPEGLRQIFNFLFEVRVGGGPSQETLEYFAKAFSEIWRGSDPKQALRLTGSTSATNRRGASNYSRYVDVAIAVELERQSCNSYAKACEIVEHKMGIPFDTVQRHHENFKADARGLLESRTDDVRLACAVRVEAERCESSSLDDAIDAVASKTGVSVADLKDWHAEFMREFAEKK